MKKFGLLLCLLLGLTACEQGETYHSLEDVREDIVFYNSEILKVVAFDDYIVFLVGEEQEQAEEAEDFFYIRVFQMKKNGDFLQTEHSASVPEGAALCYEWKEFLGDAYLIRFSVHDAKDELLEVGDGKWRYAESGDHGKWHYSYEILKRNDYGAMVPVENL